MLAFRDDLLDGQLLRTIGHASYGGAEPAECLATAKLIDPRDRDSWMRAWCELADRTMADAEAHRDPIGARRAFLRASNYCRTAYVLHLEAPLPESARDAYRKHRDAFRRAGVAEPIELGGLPGYFCSGGAGARPIVVAVGGYDGTAEEGYFWNAAAAVERGWHCVMFDGPGQGAMLFDRGATMTPDWRPTFAAVIDAIAARPDVGNIVVWGESFGGYLAPQIARDPRVAALVLDPAQLGLFRAVLARIPLPASVKAKLPDGPRWAVKLLRHVMARRARDLTAGWALRRGMLVHGVASPWDYIVETARYDQVDVASIRCPTVVCDADADDISAAARAFYDQLTCDKRYLRFEAKHGLGAHCISGARSILHARVFDRLGEVLATRSIAA